MVGVQEIRFIKIESILFKVRLVRLSLLTFPLCPSKGSTLGIQLSMISISIDNHQRFPFFSTMPEVSLMKALFLGLTCLQLCSAQFFLLPRDPKSVEQEAWGRQSQCPQVRIFSYNSFPFPSRNVSVH
jgi:hypothetical protein